MSSTIEVCSVVDGAWYDVVPGHCSFVWYKGSPLLRVKYKFRSRDFDYDDCEFFSLEHMYEPRFRKPFQLAEEETNMQTGQNIVGFAKSESEEKWFDATVERITVKEDDIEVRVEWCMGAYRFIFGQPLNDVLSIARGEIGVPSEYLDPHSLPILHIWIKTFAELLEIDEKEFKMTKLRIPIQSQKMKDPSFVQDTDPAPRSLREKEDCLAKEQQETKRLKKLAKDSKGKASVVDKVE